MEVLGRSQPRVIGGTEGKQTHRRHRGREGTSRGR